MKSYVFFFQLPELFNPSSIICLIHSSYATLVSWHPGCSWEQLNSHMRENIFSYVFGYFRSVILFNRFKICKPPPFHHPSGMLLVGVPRDCKAEMRKTTKGTEKHAFHRSSRWHTVKKYIANKLNLVSSWKEIDSSPLCLFSKLLLLFYF